MIQNSVGARHAVLKPAPRDMALFCTIAAMCFLRICPKAFLTSRLIATRSGNDLVMGPLKVMPIAQYSCLVRSGQYSNTTNEFYFQNAARVHFYYSANRRPSNLSPGETTYTCHDFQLYGENDGPGLPRFELMSHHFSLWNAQDPRFQTLQGSESPKINTLIQNDLNWNPKLELEDGLIDCYKNDYSLNDLRTIWADIPHYERYIDEQVEINAHYSGYLPKQENDIMTFKKVK